MTRGQPTTKRCCVLSGWKGQTTSEAVLCPLWLEGTDHERSGALSSLTKLPLPLGEGRGEGTHSARLAAATLTPIPTLSRKRERE
jgi:hypothetical protein